VFAVELNIKPKQTFCKIQNQPFCCLFGVAAAIIKQIFKTLLTCDKLNVIILQGTMTQAL
jgi:hypothetical protein